jgi:hypothetical protein
LPQGHVIQEYQCRFVHGELFTFFLEEKETAEAGSEWKWPLNWTLNNELDGGNLISMPFMQFRHLINANIGMNKNVL